MLISSMDQLNYYSMPKDGYLEIDTSSPNGYSMDQQTLDDEGSPTYLNEENSPKNGTKSSLYKTELCKRFSEFGSCRYGTKCQFAHGLAELRHVLRHPKYKTTKCKSYWGSGHCPYGSRCRFIHEEAESMTQPQFSPQSAMGGGMNGGMFFQDQQLPGLATSLDGASHASMAAATNSYLYGARGIAPSNDDHVLPGASYQKEYSLLGSFDKDVATPWGMGSRGATYNGSVAATATGVVSTEPPVYPDLQDAIDSLMRFSLAPTESEAAGAGSANGAMASSAPLGTITTTPVDSRLTAAGVAGDAAAKTKKDFSLQSDELWTDFPSLSTTSSSDFGDKQWPTGLSLSLEGTGLFSSSTSTSTTSVSTTSVDNKQPELSPTTASSAANKKDETSPRLSIFERFH